MTTDTRTDLDEIKVTTVSTEIVETMARQIAHTRRTLAYNGDAYVIAEIDALAARLCASFSATVPGFRSAAFLAWTGTVPVRY